MKNFIHKKYRLLRFFIKLFIILLLTPVIYNYIPVHKGKSTFYLPSSDINTVINTLKEYGYGVSLIDKVMLSIVKPPEAGWYTVTKTPKKRFKFFESLKQDKAKTMRVKIYAGENSIELTKRLARDLKLSHRKLLQEYRRQTRFLEGDIFSGYYKIARKADERTVITALFQSSSEKLKTFAKHYCANGEDPNPLEIKILLIIASIIQKETNNYNEMSLISSVIQNRLNRGMKLQMDGTLNYGEHSHKAITPKRIRKDTSYYNTYKYGGIPPAPLCAVSLKALNAAINPSKTNYLYFMLNKNGKHDFASSYKEHVKNIKKFRQKQPPETDTSSKQS